MTRDLEFVANISSDILSFIDNHRAGTCSNGFTHTHRSSCCTSEETVTSGIIIIDIRIAELECEDVINQRFCEIKLIGIPASGDFRSDQSVFSVRNRTPVVRTVVKLSSPSSLIGEE